MYIRKIAAAAGFACGAALTFSPFASADASNDWLASFDSLLGGAAPAATAATTNFQISFNGTDLFPTTGNLATATTVLGQYGVAIAYGNGANATAEGGFGNFALADGTDALAKAGSTAHATGFDYNQAVDIGNNTNTGAIGAPDGAYAGGGSLIGNTDATNAAGVVTSSHNSAYDIGNNGLDTEALNGGNSGAFAGDSGLIGYNHVAGNGDTAYTFGDIKGFGDGSAAVAGNNNYASTSGAETGTNEGGFAGFGNNNSAIADTSYTHDNAGVSATFGNNNYAYVYGPNNSTADAGGNAAHLGNNNVAYVNDPYGMSGPADSATAGSTSTAAGNNDLAEVLYTHGNADATGADFRYDIITPFGQAGPATAASAAAEPAALGAPAADPLAGTVDSEIAQMNSLFQFEALLAGDYNDITHTTTPGTFDTFLTSALLAKDAPDVDPGGNASLVTPLEYELYGVNPITAGISDGTGPFNEFNGALSEFYNAYNTELYSLLNPGATIPVADLFGGSSLAEALATPAAMGGPVGDFLTDGWNDLLGYFGIFN